MVKISGNGCVRAVSVPLLKPTFGRCAENPEDRLTFGRWEMVKISGNGCVRAVDGTAGELAGSVRLEKCIQCGEIFFCMGECGLEVLAVEFTEGDERGGGPVFRTQQPTPTERYVRHRFWV